MAREVLGKVPDKPCHPTIGQLPCLVRLLGEVEEASPPPVST
jgi:hypothetical protein